MNNQVLSYDDFINEALKVVKRKYTEEHPARIVSTHAPVRERVMSFLNDRNEVEESDLSQFLKMINEESGRRTNMGWVKANSRYFKVRESEGKKFYSLSSEGKRVHKVITSGI